jgi:hypothetical protein
MGKLKERIYDKDNGLDYMLVGDYYIPDIQLRNVDDRPIGRWGRMHRDYLRDFRPVVYNELFLSGKLHIVLVDLNEQAQQRLELIIRQMQEQEGITEALKRQDAMLWVRSMNSVRSQAEEIVLSEIVYR